MIMDDMKLGVASVQRLDHHSFLEWFAYYLINGVDRFIIRNHSMPGDPADPVVGWLERLSAHYDIDRADCTGYNTYPAVQQAIMDGPRMDLDWLIWADGDEFHLPLVKPTIRSTLEAYKDAPISALGIYWVNFGANNWTSEPELITQGFTRRSKFSELVNHHMKPIVKGRHAGQVRVTNPHVYTTEHGTFDLMGRLIAPHCGLNHPSVGCVGQVTHDIMRINHYQCRSWQYFKEVKQQRGPGDRTPDAPGGTITDEWWHMNNFNDQEDTLLWDKFGKAITEKVALLKEQIS
jgi:hypothetical protein